ncbi:MAG: hypothetical protein A2122_00990 [Candidatus Liptonbacteria bacterium GWB1_49_6]|uniref:Uncharacterized protein n=1 Tax=Candidatus Liptonbacteria bacterium GWB1_49_6 TaxID=1798644 RepID=A0A1G2C6B6_9BACT|nr:MAG: hypothetical protein A2122_00990 [Candidatus Liptonbacteria bacterium GWB1_49_6]
MVPVIGFRPSHLISKNHRFTRLFLTNLRLWLLGKESSYFRFREALLVWGALFLVSKKWLCPTGKVGHVSGLVTV